MLPNHYFLAFRWIWTEQLGLPATPVNSLALQAAIHAHDITLSSPRLTDDVICSVLFCCHHSQINLGFIYLRFLFPELCRLFSPAKSNLLFLFLSGHGVCPSIFGHADWCRDSKTNLLISWWLSYTNLDLGAPKFLFCFLFFKILLIGLFWIFSPIMHSFTDIKISLDFEYFSENARSTLGINVENLFFCLIIKLFM